MLGAHRVFCVFIIPVMLLAVSGCHQTQDRTAANRQLPKTTRAVRANRPPLPPPDPFAGAAWKSCEVAISEIAPPLNAGGQTTWVELFNYGSTPVDMRGWILCDTSGIIYRLPDTLASVPVKGIVLIKFTGKSSPRRDHVSFTGGKTATLYQRATIATTALRGVSNECALYAAAEPSADVMLDYACWGTWPSSPHADNAVAVGLAFPDRRPLTKDKHRPTDPVPDIRVLQPGEGFARPYFETPKRGTSPWSWWEVYPQHLLTPGTRNGWPAPYMRNPQHNGTAVWEENGIIFGWHYPSTMCIREGQERWETHLQVASDAQFRKLIVDLVVKTPYRHLLDPGVYYCRVRLERENETSPWSDTCRFTVEKMRNNYPPLRKRPLS